MDESDDILSLQGDELNLNARSLMDWQTEKDETIDRRLKFECWRISASEVRCRWEAGCFQE
jgi:pterin-4a-carbinolamine dehydratase